MAETIYGPFLQLYALHDRDAFHLDHDQIVFESSLLPHGMKDGHFGKPIAERDRPKDGDGRASLHGLVRGLMRDPMNRSAFLAALHRDSGLVGRAPEHEELVDLVVARLHEGKLLLVPLVPDKEIGGGSESGVAVEQKGPEKPPPKKEVIVCKLEHADIECSHESGGRPRKPKNGVLEVVPPEAGDTIKLEGDWDGGCANHPSWTITGFWTGTEKKPKASFKARPWFVGSPTGTMMLRWLSGVAPKTYTVTASGCDGNKHFTVKSYPADKLTVTIDGEKWEALQSKLDWFIHHVIGRVLKEPKFDILKGKASVSAQWTEWKDHTAYYKWDAAVGFNPLIGGKIRVPFGPFAAIPQWMKDLACSEAGFFVEFGGGINVNGHWARATPEKAKMYADANGYVYGKIGAELKLMSKKVMAVEVAGKSGFGMNAAPDYKEDKPTLLIELKWEGVKGLVTATAAWGWIEIEHEFNIVDEQTIWEKHPFHLVEEHAG